MVHRLFMPRSGYGSPTNHLIVTRTELLNEKFTQFRRNFVISYAFIFLQHVKDNTILFAL